MSMQRWFDGLKSGDAAIIRDIYSSLLPKVKAWIVKNGGTSIVADDIFQDVLETILLKIERVDKSFEGLVMQIAKYKWYDKIRKSKKEVRTEDSLRLIHSDLDIESNIIKAEESYIRYKLMDTTFNKLSDLCQKLLQKIKTGLSADQICGELNFNNKNTLYRRKAACIQRWSTLISEAKTSYSA